MEQNSLFTPKQWSIFSEIASSVYFRENFYFTGGTALSYFHLQHRESEDLDFFSENKIDQDFIFGYIESLSIKYDFKFSAEFKEVVYIFMLNFDDGEVLKVDFGHYPVKRLEKGNEVEDFAIDSLTDISVNKLSTINRRKSVKDYVDLYFILRDTDLTLWDLIVGVNEKFGMELEPLMVASDLLMIEDFDYLPRMIKPLTLDELKTFFRKKAKEVAGVAVE